METLQIMNNLDYTLFSSYYFTILKRLVFSRYYLLI